MKIIFQRIVSYRKLNTLFWFDKLEVIDLHDAGNPLTMGKIPVLTCDVWGTKVSLETIPKMNSLSC
jgi:hypothetical protein